VAHFLAFFNQQQSLVPFLQPLTELLERIEEELRRVEEYRATSGRADGEGGGEEQKLRMLQQEITHTHKVISTMTKDKGTEITEEVFSSIKKQVEGWLGPRNLLKMGNNKRGRTPPREDEEEPTKIFGVEGKPTHLPALQPNPWHSLHPYDPLTRSPPTSYHPQPPTFPNPHQSQWFPGPLVLPPLSSMPLPHHNHPHQQQQPPFSPQRFPLPPLGSSSSYFAPHTKDRQSIPSSDDRVPLPSLREKLHQITVPAPVPPSPSSDKLRRGQPTIVIGEDEIESGTVRVTSRSPSPNSAPSSSERVVVVKTPKQEPKEEQFDDKLSYLVHSASQMSEQFFEEKEGATNKRRSNGSPIGHRRSHSITPSTEEGAQVLLSKLAELCQERAQAELGHTDSNDESDGMDRKRKRNSKFKKGSGASDMLKVKRRKSDSESEDISAERSPTPEVKSNSSYMFFLYLPFDLCNNFIQPGVPTGGGGGGGGGQSKKPPRRTKTPEQLEVLEREYTMSIFPSTAKRLAISKQTGLTPRGVQIWFQNKRAKDKANKRILRNPDGSSTLVPFSGAPHSMGVPMSTTPSPPQSKQGGPPLSSTGASYPYYPHPHSPHHVQPNPSHLQLPSFLSNGSPSSPSKPILPPPAAMYGTSPYGGGSQSLHPAHSYPYNHHQPHHHHPALPPRKEKPEIWRGTLSWHDSPHESTPGRVMIASLVARAHEWSEPSHWYALPCTCLFFFRYLTLASKLYQRTR